MQICPNCSEENPARFRLCGFCGSPLAPAVPAQEVRKTVSVVFSDLQGSTSLGEKLDSEALREVMSRYFDEMRTVLEQHGGTVEKYIGDAIMAVFGLPRVHEDDALRAVRAAHGMQTALAGLNDELERRWGVRLTNRTGVNTGEVVAGDPTTGQRLVTGDTVNVAARLEQAAPGLEVLIGEPTYRLVREAVAVERVEPLELKGKSEPVPAYRLLSVSADREGVLRRRDAPLVGRDRELRVMLDAFDEAVRTRRCRMVMTLGDAGVGKSRLAEEFFARIPEDALRIRGRCLPYGEGITFWPLSEAVRQAAGIGERDDADAALGKLSELIGPREDEVVARVASAIGLSETPFPVAELFWGIRRLFALLAARRPLAVVFGDLHWAEGVFLDLVQDLAATLEDAPVVLLCDARPTLLEQHPGWRDDPVGAVVELEPLTTADTHRVIENLLGAVGVDADVQARIVDAAGGNPLFVEQLLSMLIDEQLVRFENGGWRAVGELPGVTIPPTIQALLSARLDSLDREERAVIDPASVIGHIFPEQAVRDLAPDVIRENVGTHLLTLSQKRLVRPDPTERSFEDAFRFDHVLIKDTTYDALLKRVRASLHERFVVWADRVNGDRAMEYEEILGYHLEQAYRYLRELGPLDDHGRALGDDGARRLASAGRRARSRGDLAAAANLLGRATELLPTRSLDRLELLPTLGETLIDLGRFDGARSTLDEAVSGARDAHDERLGAEALLMHLLLQLRSGETEEWRDVVWSEVATPRIEAAIAVFTAANDHLGLAKAYRVLGYVHGTACQYGAAAAAAERGLRHAELAGDAVEARGAATSYALAACLGPTPVDEAIVRCDEIRMQVSANRLSSGWVLCLLAQLHAMQGDFDGARRLYHEGRAAIRELSGAGWHSAWTSLAGSRIEMLAGNSAAAEAELRDAAAILEHIGEQYLLSTVIALLARALCAQGRHQEADPLTLRAAELAGADDVETQAEWRATRVQVLVASGRPEEASLLAQDALQLLLPTDSAVMKVEALIDLANVYADLGDETAEWAYREAIALAARKGNSVAAGEARALLDRLEAGRAEQARSLP